MRAAVAGPLQPNAVAPARSSGTMLLLNGSPYAHEADLVSYVGY